MPRSLEELLRSGMDEATTSVRADDEFVAGMIEHGRTARKRRRRTTLIGVAVATVAVVAGASLVPLTRSEDNGADAPQPHPTASQYPLDWAKSLPAGPPTELSYIARGMLHSGDQEIPLPGDWYGLYGKVRGGWLISVEHLNDRGMPMPAESGYGVLTVNGAFERLPADPYEGAVQVKALAPDGRLFAQGGALIDVETKTVVGRLPDNAFLSIAWTSVGLVYEDRQWNRWLWRPGTPPMPVQLESNYYVITTDPARVTTRGSDGCTEIADLHADGSLSTVHRVCVADPVLALSPNGTYVVDRDFSVIHLADGTVESYPEVPEEIVQRGAVWFEDDDHFIVSAEGTDSTRGSMGDPGGPRHAILVRCTVSTHECERAGNRFTLVASDQLDLM